MRNLQIKSRWLAASIHMLLSVGVVGCVSALILLHWYPGEFRHYGGSFAIILVAGVDVVLGPALTLVIYNTKKKYLFIDLSIIAAIQLGALVFGLHSVYQGRPIAKVVSHKGVNIVTQAEIDHFKINIETFTTENSDTPISVYLDLPSSPEQRQAVELATEFMERKPLYLRTDLYQHFPSSEPQKVTQLLISEPQKKNDNDCISVAIFALENKLSGCIDSESGKIKNIRKIK